MTNTTYCDEEKQKECEHWDAEIGECKYLRTDGTCFIGGIEKDYEKKDEQSQCVALYSYRNVVA